MNRLEIRDDCRTAKDAWARAVAAHRRRARAHIPRPIPIAETRSAPVTFHFAAPQPCELLEPWLCFALLMFAINALTEAMKMETRNLQTIVGVQRMVAAHYGISRSDILSSRRTHNVVHPRQVAMYLAKIVTLKSLPEIGRMFGGKDHTTVLHAVRKIGARIPFDPELANDIAALKMELAIDQP